MKLNRKTDEYLRWIECQPYEEVQTIIWRGLRIQNQSMSATNMCSYTLSP